MSSKLLPVDVVRRHYETLYDHRLRTKKVRVLDVLSQLGLPLAAGALVWWRGITLSGASQLLSGVAILAGFVFGLLVFVFQLRLQAVEDPRIANEGPVTTLLDELFANVAYTALVGLATAVVIMAPLAVETRTGLALPWSIVTVVFSTHFVLLLMMCVKRTDVAYQRFRNL